MKKKQNDPISQSPKKKYEFGTVEKIILDTKDYDSRIFAFADPMSSPSYDYGADPSVTFPT